MVEIKFQLKDPFWVNCDLKKGDDLNIMSMLSTNSTAIDGTMSIYKVQMEELEDIEIVKPVWFEVVGPQMVDQVVTPERVMYVDEYDIAKLAPKSKDSLASIAYSFLHQTVSKLEDVEFFQAEEFFKRATVHQAACFTSENVIQDPFKMRPAAFLRNFNVIPGVANVSLNKPYCSSDPVYTTHIQFQKGQKGQQKITDYFKRVKRCAAAAAADDDDDAVILKHIESTPKTIQTTVKWKEYGCKLTLSQEVVPRKRRRMNKNESNEVKGTLSSLHWRIDPQMLKQMTERLQIKPSVPENEIPQTLVFRKIHSSAFWKRPMSNLPKIDISAGIPSSKVISKSNLNPLNASRAMKTNFIETSRAVCFKEVCDYSAYSSDTETESDGGLFDMDTVDVCMATGKYLVPLYKSDASQNVMIEPRSKAKVYMIKRNKQTRKRTHKHSKVVKRQRKRVKREPVDITEEGVEIFEILSSSSSSDSETEMTANGRRCQIPL